ncbi:MAG: hypothetical protein KIC60_00775 [Clostridium sp.]|nr:hypothetical protein [Clostridium sp.]
MREKLKNIKYFLIILIAAIIISFPLLKDNINVYFDDGIQHIGRAYETYLEIQNKGNPKILSNLTNGFGYSWDLFYGPLSTTLIVITRLISGTFINSYKLVLFIGILISGITMYKFVSNLTKNEITGTIAGVLYMTMPYHLNDMYIRNALGEFLSYIFIPLVFLGMYKLFSKEKGEWILTVGATRINIYT